MRSRLFEKSAFCVLSHSIFKIHYRKSDKVIVYRLVRLNNFTIRHFRVKVLYKSRFLSPQGPFSFRCRLDNRQVFDLIIGHLLSFQNIGCKALGSFICLLHIQYNTLLFFLCKTNFKL